MAPNCSKTLMAFAFMTIVACSLIAVPAYAATWYSLGGATSSSPAVTRVFINGNVELHVIVRGVNGIYHRRADCGPTGSSCVWDAWVSLGGATNDQPAVAVTQGPGQPQTMYLHVVVRGVDNVLYYKKFSLYSKTWEASWTKLGGATSSAPALTRVLTGQESFYLFVRGTNNGIYYKVGWVGSGAVTTWSGWNQIPGATIDVPAIAIDPSNYLHLVVRGMNNGIYHTKTMLNDIALVWAAWTNLGGTTYSAPAIEAGGSATFPSLNVVVRGTSDVVYYRFWGATGWAIGWMNLGGLTTDRPDLAKTSYFSLSGGGTVLHFFVRGTNDAIYERKLDCPVGQSCVWSAWLYLNGKTLSAPAAEGDTWQSTWSWAACVVRGTDSKAYWAYV